MIVYDDLEQLSEEWFEKHNIPSASHLSEILTTKGKASTQKTAYQHRLLSKEMGARHEEGYTSAKMQRGIDMESEAVAYYEMLNDVDVDHPGWCLREDNLAGCSPDGLITKDGLYDKGLEVKCPDAHTHVKYLLNNKLPTEYFCQVQGSMYVCDMDRWDFMSYHPDLPPLLITVRRNVDWCADLHLALLGFNNEMIELRRQMRLLGYAA